MDSNVLIKERLKKNKIRIVFTLILLFAFVTIGYFSYTDYNNDMLEYKKYQSVLKKYNNYFDDGEASKNLTSKELKELKSNINSVNSKYSKSKKKMNKIINDYEKYEKFKNEIKSIYKNKVMSSSVTSQKIDSLESKYSSLSGNYKKEVEDIISSMKRQRRDLDNIDASILNIYADNTKTTFKDYLTKEEINNIRTSLLNIKQTDVVQKYTQVLDSADAYIDSLANAQNVTNTNNLVSMNNSWKVINVSYISSNKSGIYNGSIPASLLMALQYKGYNTSNTLKDISDAIPKSVNPNQGFSYDIYGLDPTNVPHYISPYPLVKFAKSYSGNQNIINGTDKSLDVLNNEVVNGNPVIIYLTSGLSTPREWVEGAPNNMSAMLLTGYNAETGEELLTDPWMRDDGSYTWTVSKASLENLYNAVGKRAVIVR